jgi:acetyl esterase/lipase
MPLSVTTNVSYTHTRTLDVYAPATSGDWPLVVVLHQNASVKETMYGLSKAIAGQGAVVFAPDYEEPAQGMTPGRLMLSGDENAACAIRFARAHVAEYGGNDRRVLVVGHSQGAFVGAVMMFAGNEFPGDCLTEGGSAMPDAFVGVDGGYDPIPHLSEEKLKAAPAEAIKIDPFTYIGQKPIREGVRFVLFAGDFEPAVLSSQAFRDALQAAGYDVSFTRIPGADHMEMASGRVPQITRAIADLLRPQ